MGADGGINWVRVVDRNLFRKLVGPLCLLWDGSSHYDQYHHQYLERRPLPADYEVSRYSNLPGYNYGLQDLEEILKDIEYWTQSRIENSSYCDPYFGTSDLREMTWEEILEEYYTHPDTTHWCIPCLVSLMVQEHGFWFKNGRSKAWPGSEMFSMKIGDWYDAVIRCIDRNSFGSAETWT